MAKVFKVIGIIAGAVALVAGAISTFGIGSPAFAALAGKVAAIAGVVGSAATLGANLLARPPNARGSVNQLVISSNAPTPYMMGESYSGGVLVHDTGYGGEVDKIQNPYRFMVVIYSICGGALVGSYADFTEIAFSGTSALGYYNGFLYRDAQFGASPEFDALAPHWSGAADWGSDYRLSGKAATGWSLKFDKKGKKFASGVPQFGEVRGGVSVYDPRLDSTYPGGAGAHRIADETTWAVSDNPALHAIAYLYGRHQNGLKVFGVGLDAAGIDFAAFVAWANVCDANGWTIAGTIYEPGDRWNNLKLICQAGGAEPCFRGALVSVRWQAPKIALDTITPDDLADGEIRFTGAKPWKTRLNGIVPKFRSAAHQWEYVQSNLVQHPAALAEDGEDKIEERQFDLVTNKDQAAQLAAYGVADAREMGPIIVPCKPRMIEYRSGDVLELDLPDIWPAPLNCEILERSVEPETGIVTFTMQTDSAAKHDFALSQIGAAPPTKTLSSPSDRDNVTGGNTLDVASERVLIQNSYPIGVTIIASDAGDGTATISVSAHMRRYADRDVSVTAASLLGLANATVYYLFYDDADRVGGAVVIEATTIDGGARLSDGHPYRHFVGLVTTPGPGGGDSGGAAGGAPGGVAIFTLGD